jgi:hypothetical protein
LRTVIAPGSDWSTTDEYQAISRTMTNSKSQTENERGMKPMSLQTRKNPNTGALEVLVNDKWTPFEDYRKRQIDEAYQNSIRFLRDRLGDDEGRKLEEQSNRSED